MSAKVIWYHRSTENLTYFEKNQHNQTGVNKPLFNY